MHFAICARSLLTSRAADGTPTTNVVPGHGATRRASLGHNDDGWGISWISAGSWHPATTWYDTPALDNSRLRRERGIKVTRARFQGARITGHVKRECAALRNSQTLRRTVSRRRRMHLVQVVAPKFGAPINLVGKILRSGLGTRQQRRKYHDHYQACRVYEKLRIGSR